MTAIIIIPARYHSTRFPGKPLAKIAGASMLSRVYAIACKAADHNTRVVVATDDERIMDHCKTIGAEAVMTARDCRTGTDRALLALDALNLKPDIIINLQGDAPLTPPECITAMLAALRTRPADIVTPVIPLSWEQLDALRNAKQKTPFSGTTVVLDKKNNALWFSKNIIPALRDEDTQRKLIPLSPVYGHIGLYGYRYLALKTFCALKESSYEKLEGLEQLRALENGLTVHCIKINTQQQSLFSGVDSPEDILRVEKILASLT